MVEQGDIERSLDRRDCSWHDAGIMSALYFKRFVFHCGIIHRFLRLGDRRCRLDSHTQGYRHSAGDAAEDTAVVIGSGNDIALIVDIELVVVFRAGELCAFKARAELKALDCGDTED